MRYRFGECELDAEKYQLYRAGRPVELRPKALELLIHLVRHAGNTLGKEELVAALWPQRVISDATLNSSVREVRQAIGDSGAEQRLIKTIYGKGYRFIGTVTTGEPRDGEIADPATRPMTRPPCPYPGMVPFRAEDAAHFHGRAREIARMVGLLRRQNFMMVIGPSGSGKSSLVQAGLLPELEHGRHFDPGYWLIRRMRPGPMPSTELGRIFGTRVKPEEPDIESVDRMLEAHPPACRLLLLVDQFEEAFAQAERDETTQFINALQGLRTRQNLTLVLTLRADFYPELMTSYLWPVDMSQRVEVAPLRGDALREAVVRPAEDVGVDIDPGLVERLLADAADEPGVLPLLQETMRMLWDEMENNTLSLAAYERLGYGATAGTTTGLAAAIAMKADATLAALAAEQQAIARQIFLRLVQFGEGRADTRRQQPLPALRAADDDPLLFQSTIDHLTDHRLLTLDSGDEPGNTLVDIAHESLITSWVRLQNWTEERREAEQVRRRLEAKVAEWERLGQGTGGLLDEAELPEAERWLTGPDAADLGLSEGLPDLVRASHAALERATREREDARQRELTQARTLADTQARAARGLRRLSALLAGVFVVALVAAVYAWWQRDQAQTLAEQEAAARQDAETRRQESEQARAQAELLRADTIAQLLLTLAPEQQAIEEHERAALMARQAYLLGAREPGRLHDLADRVVRAVLREPGFGPNLASEVDAVAISPDGRTLAASSRAGAQLGRLQLWTLANHGAPPITLQGPDESYFFAISFSPDGKGFAAANNQGTVLLWDLERPDGEPEVLAEHEAGAWSLVFSPDGRRIAVGGKRDDSVRLLDLSNADGGIVLGATEPPTEGEERTWWDGALVAFSPDGNMLASGHHDGLVKMWGIDAAAEPIRTYRGHEGAVRSLAFSPDGGRLASGGEDATVRIWDLHDTSTTPRILHGHDHPVSSLAFEADSETLVSSSTTRGRYVIGQWDLSDPDDDLVVLRQGVGYSRMTFDPHRSRVVVTDDGSKGLRLLNLQASSRPRILPVENGNSNQLAFSPDGRLLASSTTVGVIEVWELDDPTRPAAILREHRGVVAGVAFSPDGKLLSSTSPVDRTVRIWQVGDPIEQIKVLRADDDPWIAPFSPDGKLLAIAGWDDNLDFGTVELWNLSDLDADPLVLPNEMKRWINAIALSHDGMWLAATGREGIIHLEDLTNPGAGARTLRGHDGMTWSLAFHPNGRRLASGGRDRTVRLWDLTDPAIPSSILGRHDDDVLKVRFSPDGRYLASSSEDESIRMWDLDNPDAPPVLLYGQEDRVWGLAFSPNGRTLASGGGGKGVLLWDLTHPLNSAPLDQLVELICAKVWRNLTAEEWREFVGDDIPYERTCPDLPADPNVTNDR